MTTTKNTPIPQEDWDYWTRISSWTTFYFGRVLEARARRPLTKREMNTLERSARKLATEIADFELKRGKGAKMRRSTLDRHVDKFYAKFGLRLRAAA